VIKYDEASSAFNFNRFTSMTGRTEKRMSPWMQDAEKTGLLKLLESREHSAANREDLLRVKMHLEAIDAQTRAALAEERAAAAVELAANVAVKNHRYMFATVAAAGLSAVASLLITVIALVAHW
jgi:hypothetical protein